MAIVGSTDGERHPATRNLTNWKNLLIKFMNFLDESVTHRIASLSNEPSEYDRFSCDLFGIASGSKCRWIYRPFRREQTFGGMLLSREWGIIYHSLRISSLFVYCGSPGGTRDTYWKKSEAEDWGKWDLPCDISGCSSCEFDIHICRSNIFPSSPKNISLNMESSKENP